MGDELTKNISDEVLATFLDGNATAQENKEIICALFEDAELRELLHISQSVDAELYAMSHECEIIPMTAMAAACDEGNHCCLECEKYILRKLKIDFDEQQLLKNAFDRGWQKEDGTALHNVGRHLEEKGLIVTRQYKSTICDIIDALEADMNVIVAVDSGELINNNVNETIEDCLIGQNPDHTVVVLSYNSEKQEITIYDPNSSNQEDVYPVERFENAWNDSKKYLVTVNSRNMKEYIPKPIDLSDVELHDDLNELREAIAENAHEVWALERQAQGWTYGPQRDDAKKHNPCMVKYSQLPESEKKFDREMAINTLKLVKKLGYDITKREETELYKDLLSRIRNANETYYCPQCYGENVKTPVEKHQAFCHVCGCNLKQEDLYKS